MIVIVLCGTQTVFGQSISKFRSPPAANRPQPEVKIAQPELKLSGFHSITGTSFLLASLIRHGDEKGSFSKSHSSSTANYVFFNLADDCATTLLPNNDALIISLDPLTGETGRQTQSRETRRDVELTSAVEPTSVSRTSRETVRWHMVELVTADSDGDGQLTSSDRHSLGIADAGGQGFAEVIPNLGQVFSRTLVDSETLHIIHGSQTKQVAVRIELRSRKVVSSKPLPNFGTY
jgi:hypothetical protein